MLAVPRASVMLAASRMRRSSLSGITMVLISLLARLINSKLKCAWVRVVTVVAAALASNGSRLPSRAAVGRPFRVGAVPLVNTTPATVAWSLAKAAVVVHA